MIASSSMTTICGERWGSLSKRPFQPVAIACNLQAKLRGVTPVTIAPPGPLQFAAVKTQVSESSSPQASVQAAVPHVLAVDDDPVIRQLITDYLLQHGMRATAVADGAAMQAVLDEQVVDLIVLDLRLQAEDGMVLARRLRDESAIPFIMLTGRA